MSEIHKSRRSRDSSGALDLDPGVLGVITLRVLQAIDRGEAELLWQRASPVARKAAQGDFVARVEQIRESVGGASERRWMTIRRLEVTDAFRMPPPGKYFSAEFATRFQDGVEALEMVSLRHDEDGVWRLAGYTFNRLAHRSRNMDKPVPA